MEEDSYLDPDDELPPFFQELCESGYFGDLQLRMKKSRSCCSPGVTGAAEAVSRTAAGVGE